MRFYGVVGFGETKETSPGVWVDEIVERRYSGDLIRNIKRIDGDRNINDNINVNNEISIVSDPYANKNFHQIRYVEFMGARWKVTSVQVEFPRLVLSVGNVWNGEEVDDEE